MKQLFLTVLLTVLLYSSGEAQQNFGNTWNLGIGAGGYSGYYGYVGRPIPVFHVGYEFEVRKSFTIAPFINFYTFSDNYYWGDSYNTSRYYDHRQTVVPVGVKGSYYFDDLLDAGDRWDFYAAGSLGLTLMNSRWDKDYKGDLNHFDGPNSIFLDVHIGAEYLIYSRLGVFVDVSSGVSTFGLSIH